MNTKRVNRHRATTRRGPGDHGATVAVRLGLLLAGFLVCCLPVGCGSWRSVPSPPPDPTAARQALTTALEAWTAGDMPEQLHEQRPAIYMADEQWLFGGKLHEFTILDDGASQGNQVRFRVQLGLLPAERSTPSRQEVKYLVTSGASWSIVRDDS